MARRLHIARGRRKYKKPKASSTRHTNPFKGKVMEPRPLLFWMYVIERVSSEIYARLLLLYFCALLLWCSPLKVLDVGEQSECSKRGSG